MTKKQKEEIKRLLEEVNKAQNASEKALHDLKILF